MNDRTLQRSNECTLTDPHLSCPSFMKFHVKKLFIRHPDINVVFQRKFFLYNGLCGDL